MVVPCPLLIAAAMNVFCRAVLLLSQRKLSSREVSQKETLGRFSGSQSRCCEGDEIRRISLLADLKLRCGRH